MTVEHMPGCVSSKKGTILLCDLRHSTSDACTILPVAKWATDGSTDIADAAFESRYKTEHLRFFLSLLASWVKSRGHEWIGQKGG